MLGIRRVRYAALTIMVAGLTAVMALGASAATARGTHTAAPQLSQDSITVLATPNPFVAPIILGQKRGFFKALGLNVKFKATTSGATLVPALISGSADVALPSITVPVTAAQAGANLKIIGTLGHQTELGMQINGRTARKLGIRANASSDAQIKALKGSKITIGVSSPVGGVYRQTAAILRARGVEPGTDVTLVSYPTPDAEFAAYTAGQVDAYVWTPPISLLPPKDNVVRIQYRQLTEYKGVEFIVLTVNGNLAKDHPDTLQAFMTGLLKGWVLAQKNPAAAVQTLGRLYPTFSKAFLEEINKSASANYAPTIAITRAGFAKGLKLTNLTLPQPTTVTFEQMVDNTAINAAIKKLKLKIPLGG